MTTEIDPMQNYYNERGISVINSERAPFESLLFCMNAYRNYRMAYAANDGAEAQRLQLQLALLTTNQKAAQRAVEELPLLEQAKLYAEQVQRMTIQRADIPDEVWDAYYEQHYTFFAEQVNTAVLAYNGTAQAVTARVEDRGLARRDSADLVAYA